MPTTINFWFDPGCPFTWRTSRWLSDVAKRRGIEIQWHLMSLAELNKDKELPPELQARMDGFKLLGQTLEVVRREHGNAALGAAYTALGTRLHDSNQEADEPTIRAALADEGLPGRLIDQARSAEIATAVAESHQAGQASAGQESGSPILAIGGRPGWFGPIVVPIPTGDEADRLFDAVVTLSEVPSFSELKRARQSF